MDRKKNKNKNFADDNRTVADMSEVERAGLFNIFSDRRPKTPKETPIPQEKPELTKEERKALLRAAYGFSFKIALAGVGMLFLCFFVIWIFLKLS